MEVGRLRVVVAWYYGPLRKVSEFELVRGVRLLVLDAAHPVRWIYGSESSSINGNGRIVTFVTKKRKCDGLWQSTWQSILRG